MNTAEDTDKIIDQKKRGQQLVQAERNVLMSKMLDLMTEGYVSTYMLSKKCHVSRDTIDRYRPLVDELIAKTKINRNAIRSLQIRRTYNIIEMLMEDLKTAVGAKDRSAYYNQIFKFSSHLALITGLNVETQVNIDPTKLVIIRSNTKKNTKNAPEVIDTPETRELPELA